MRIHLRYAALLTDRNKRRVIIALQDSLDDPVVFMRHWVGDAYEGSDSYSLYGNALTSAQAEKIMEQIKAGDMSKARALFRRCFKRDEPRCEEVSPMIFDDMVPDKWYDMWKEMEAVITAAEHQTGCWEVDFEERGFLSLHETGADIL